MQKPGFTFDDIKFAEGSATFKRAMDLYQSGKVKNIMETPFGYSATVHGTHAYAVSVSFRRVDEGDCNCYLGKNDRLCKHMLALALASLKISGKMEEVVTEPPAPADLAAAKKQVNEAMRNLKHYTGPSRTWFTYQSRLATAAGMIIHAVSGLPPSKENAAYLWNIIDRIDKKLANTIDDSDGVVGECVYRVFQQLETYVTAQPELAHDLKKFTRKKTNFEFEKDLLSILHKNSTD